MKDLRKYLKSYYRNDLKSLYKFFTPKNVRVLKVTSETISSRKTYDYIIADNCIGHIEDVQKFFSTLKTRVSSNGRIIITYYNHAWEPILKLASFLGLRQRTKEQNWLDNNDIANLLNLSGFDVITVQKRFFGLTILVIARPKIEVKKDYSVSIVVPARNEEGNIPNIIKSIPKFGKFQEIIFVEGNSTDATWAKIVAEKNKKYHKNIKVKIFKQKGKGKADAVRFGFKQAKGDILMIYDADMTVDPNDLVKFYDALYSGVGEFANGTRLVYPMEKDAMQTLNKFFNKLFSVIFTWIFGQRFKDTLCGTKVFFRKDYLKFSKFRDDPFGDFELIFGAIKNNLKVVEIPVRYKERVYGQTNISRFKHGLLLLKITYLAFKQFKVE